MDPNRLFFEPHRTSLDHLNYYYYTNAFSPEECDIIISQLEQLPKQDGLTGGGDSIKSDYRVSEISWVPASDNYLWIYDRISQLTLNANKEMWNYDLWGYSDNIQYTNYYDNGGHYDWHTDLGPMLSNRKVSCVLQLTDPEELEGGDLQLNNGSGIITPPKGRGNLTIFSSFVLHRVTPLTKGNRKTLVSWISGPNFR